MTQDDAKAIENGFKSLHNDIKMVFVEVLRLRYVTGQIEMPELIANLKHLQELEKLTGGDLQITEWVETMNQHRDTFYRKIREANETNRL